jgi:hypothetical protein
MLIFGEPRQLDDGLPRKTEDDIQQERLGPRGVPGKPSPAKMTHLDPPHTAQGLRRRTQFFPALTTVNAPSAVLSLHRFCLPAAGAARRDLWPTTSKKATNAAVSCTTKLSVALGRP